jgi:signal transduction histidine kinase
VSRPIAPASSTKPARSWPERLFGRWWRRQSAARQDRYATLGPLLSVLLFLAAIISAFWYLRNEEFAREQEAVQRDAQLAQQQIRLRLIENQEELVRLARDLSTRQLDRNAFLAQSAAFTHDRPETSNLMWVNAARGLVAAYAGSSFPPETGMGVTETPASLPRGTGGGEPELAFQRAREGRASVYSRPFVDTFGNSVFQVQVPLVERGAFAGGADRRVLDRAAAALPRAGRGDEAPHRLAGRRTHQRRAHELRALAAGFHGAARGDRLGAPGRPGGERADAAQRGASDVDRPDRQHALLDGGAALGSHRLDAARHLAAHAPPAADAGRPRLRDQLPPGDGELHADRHAGDGPRRPAHVREPGLLRHDRVLGDELIGLVPPYPYWPPEKREENARLLAQELEGRSPIGGIEVKVQRKDGTTFDARMYVSPLIDARGQQTGWMTSMTNITEAKRIRDQLTASHERFTTVLEGLDTAVSVLSVQQGELLFANRSYRIWFGVDAKGHALLSGGGTPDAPGGDATDAVESDAAVDGLGGLPAQELTSAASDSREVYVEQLGKWFDVRTRYLQWTDGRLAQMQIAADVTARRNAEVQAAQQAEKAEVTSRLVTMGEMASSVAHELNQPLTAITNYCNGMVSRVEADAIGSADLVAALRKTSHQAERAAEIIRRIRRFVKRSEPQRQIASAQQIIDDAVDLAGIELRRRNVAIRTYVAQRLPPLMVDPILIEQVLLNLLKNAAEAIDSAHLPPSRRAIELRVVPVRTEEDGESDRVHGHRQGSRPARRGHRPALRGLLLDQGRRPRHRPVALPLHHREPPRPDQGDQSLQWRRRCGVPLHLHAPRRIDALRCHSRSRLRMSLIPKKGTVYVVDDDEAVRDSLQWLLEGKDYRVKCFDSAETFLSRFDPREVACLIADIRMEGMSGLELQDKLLERRSPSPSPSSPATATCRWR